VVPVAREHHDARRAGDLPIVKLHETRRLDELVSRMDDRCPVCVRADNGPMATAVRESLDKLRALYALISGSLHASAPLVCAANTGAPPSPSPPPTVASILADLHRLMDAHAADTRVPRCKPAFFAHDSLVPPAVAAAADPSIARGRGDPEQPTPMSDVPVPSLVATEAKPAKDAPAKAAPAKAAIAKAAPAKAAATAAVALDDM